MNPDSASYADVFAALGSEARLEVMRLLFAVYPEGMTVGDLQGQLQIPNSTLSHHLEKLRVEKLVKVKRDRQFLWYSANVEIVENLLTFLYNGCSVRVSTTPKIQQLLELSTEKTSVQSDFLFKNFVQSLQSFFHQIHLKLPGFERFTEKAIESILLAQAETRRQRHNYLGTEQLLLGLLAQETGLVSEVFQAAGIELEPVRQAVERIIGHGSGSPDKIPFTPRAKKTLEIALKQAKQLKHSYIGAEHLLLGILVEGKGVGIRALKDLGFDCQTIEKQLRSAIDQHSV